VISIQAVEMCTNSCNLEDTNSVFLVLWRNADSLQPYAIQYTPYRDGIQFGARKNIFTQRFNYSIDTYNYVYNIDTIIAT